MVKNNGFRTLLLIALLWLAGCSSINDARKAQDTTAIPPGERTVRAKEVGLAPNSTLTINRALEIALTYHPSIVQSKQSLVIAEKQYSDAVATYLPSVNANADYGIKTSNTTAGEETNKNSKSYSTGASLNQLIYDFGKTPAAMRQAYENKLAAEASLRSTQNNIYYNVRQAYYNLIKQQSLVKVDEETVNQFQVHLDQVKELVEVGRRIKYDITKSEVDLGNARITLVDARNALRTSRAVLNNSLGLAEDPQYQVEEPAGETLSYKFDELYQSALQNQPDLAAQIAKEKASSAAVDQSIANLFPSLSLGGNYNWNGNDLPLVWNWSLTGLLNGTLFNGFRNTNQIDEAVAALRSARAARALLEQQIYLNLSQAVAQMENDREKLEIATLVVQNAKENLTLVQEQYKIGKASSIELTDALVSLSNAQSQQVQAHFNYQIDVALIKKTVGTDKIK